MASSPGIWWRGLVLLVAVGCGAGGAGAYPDAEVWGRDAGDAAATQNDGAGAGDAADDGAPDTRAPIFEPADPALTRLLVPFPAALVGYGTTTCTNAIPARADVWCAFSRLQSGAPTGAGTDPDAGAEGDAGAGPIATELWVFNFTTAVASGTLNCDGTSDACLRLSDALWTGSSIEGPSHPTSHRFDGDTLIFHAGDVPPTRDPYQGPLWAWRPGWAKASPLTSDQGLSCTGDRRTPTVFCVDAGLLEPTGSFPQFRLRAFDLRAGRLGDAAPAGLLPLVDHVAAAGSGRLVWQAGFAPRGDWFVYSSATMGMGPGVVKAVAIEGGAPTGAPVVLADDAVDWRISHDGARLYHRRGVEVGKFLATGRLAAVGFPSPGAVEVLAENVLRFELLGAHDEVVSDVERGLLVEQDDGADDSLWSLLADPKRPAEVLPFPPGAYGVAVATDLRHSLYFRDGADGQPAIHILRHDRSGFCSPKRNARSETYGGHFSHTSRLVFWVEYGGDSEEGWYAVPETCGGARKFGDYVTGYIPVGDDFVVFRGTDFDDSAYHLQYARLAADPAAPRVLPRMIDRDVDPSLVVLTKGDTVQVLYSLSREDAPTRGVFVHGPLPR
jgi:hypothetical protein